MKESRVTLMMDRLIEWAMSSGIRVLIVGLVMLLLLSLLKQVITRLRRMYEGTLPGPAQLKRADTLTHVVRDVARSVILVVGTMMILSEIGIDLKPLLAAAGLCGLAVGFGAQSLVKDVISGFFTRRDLGTQADPNTTGASRPAGQDGRPTLRRRMLGVELQGESRVRENFTHGLDYEGKRHRLAIRRRSSFTLIERNPAKAKGGAVRGRF